MDFVYPILIVIAIVATFVVVGRIADARARRRLDLVQEWKELPLEDRITAHTEFTEVFIREEADRFRSSVTFGVGVALGGALIFLWLGNATNDAENEVDQNCRKFRSLAFILGENTDQEIRATARRRNELADSVINDPSLIRELPGYSELEAPAQQFLDALFVAQIEVAQAEIDSLDEDLVLLREAEDALSAFTEDVDCPR